MAKTLQQTNLGSAKARAKKERKVKEAQRRRVAELVADRAALITATTAKVDLLAGIEDSCRRFDCVGSAVSVPATALAAADLEFCLDQSRMHATNGGAKWDADARSAELTRSGSFVLLLREPAPPGEDDDWVLVDAGGAMEEPPSPPGRKVGFAHVECRLDNNRAALCVLELQLVPEAREATIGVLELLKCAALHPPTPLLACAERGPCRRRRRTAEHHGMSHMLLVGASISG